MKIRIREDILLGLAGKDGERIKERMTEIEHELEVAKKAMSYYEEQEKHCKKNIVEYYVNIREE